MQETRREWGLPSRQDWISELVYRTLKLQLVRFSRNPSCSEVVEHSHGCWGFGRLRFLQSLTATMMLGRCAKGRMENLWEEQKSGCVAKYDWCCAGGGVKKDGVRIFQWRRTVSEFFLSSRTTLSPFIFVLSVTGEYNMWEYILFVYALFPNLEGTKICK